MRKIRVLWLIGLVLLGSAVFAEFSFLLVDNFESGSADKWYRFGNAELTVTRNATSEIRDTVAESCGDYSLKLKGSSDNWYVGGIGTDMKADASSFSRIQLDVYGSEAGGKLKIELYEDDNNNDMVEQDQARNWLATKDDEWVAEVPVLGKGFTRISIPFSAFKLANPGSGNGIWDPGQLDGSGGLLKVQLVLLTTEQKGNAEANIDNILLTY